MKVKVPVALLKRVARNDSSALTRLIDKAIQDEC